MDLFGLLQRRRVGASRRDGGGSGYQGELLLLAALFALVAASNVIWLTRDQLPMPLVDSYGYLVRLLKFIDRWDLGAIPNLWASLGRLSLAGRPPLYQIFTIPFILLFGRSEDAATCVNLVFLALLLISTYCLGRVVLNGKAGLLAAFVVASYPPLIHLSRWYSPYFAVPACCALSLWLLLLLMRNRGVGYAWLFVGSLAFGMLIHPAFLRALLVPTAIFGAYLLLFQAPPTRPDGLRQTPGWLGHKLRQRLVTHGVLPAGLIASGLVLAWYLAWGDPLFGLMRDISSPELAEYRGFTKLTLGFFEIAYSGWWPLQTMPRTISYPLTVLAMIGLVYCTIRIRWSRSVLVVTLVSFYIVATFFYPVVAWRYLSFVLPVVAVLTAVWIVDLPCRWLSIALMAVCIAIGAFNYSVVTWGIESWSGSVANALGSPLDSATCRRRVIIGFCPRPAVKSYPHWPMSEILQPILSNPSCREGSHCSLMFSGLRGRPAVRFYYYLVRDWPEVKLTVFDESSPLFGGIYRFSMLRADYLLYPVRRKPRSTNPYKVASLKFLQSPPQPFAKAHQSIAFIEIPGNRTTELIRRIKPLTAHEAKVSIAAVELPEMYQSYKYELLGQLYAEEGKLRELMKLREEAYRHGADERARAAVDRWLAAAKNRHAARSPRKNEPEVKR